MELNRNAEVTLEPAMKRDNSVALINSPDKKSGADLMIWNESGRESRAAVKNCLLLNVVLLLSKQFNFGANFRYQHQQDIKGMLKDCEWVY